MCIRDSDYHSKEFSSVNNSDTTWTSITGKVSKTTNKKVSDNSVDYYITTELTPDKKSIQYEKTTQGNVIKAQKKYEYDSEGNIAAIKQWTDDTNTDGVLDENDDIITSVSYTHLDVYKRQKQNRQFMLQIEIRAN